MKLVAQGPNDPGMKERAGVLRYNLHRLDEKVHATYEMCIWYQNEGETQETIVKQVKGGFSDFGRAVVWGINIFKTHLDLQEK